MLVLLSAAKQFLWAGGPAVSAGDSSPAPDTAGWRPLFNGRNFDGWYTWLENEGKNSDRSGVFKIEDGTVHVYPAAKHGSRQPYGYFCTRDDHSNYRLRFEYKWGTKKFMPRVETKRDAGAMYHVFGPDLLWPSSIECQVQETDTGDFVMVGTRLTVELGPPSFGLPRYAPGGKPRPGLEWHVLNRGEYNDPPEDHLEGWNTVEVVATTKTLEHYVNGKLNNRGIDPTRPDPTRPDPRDAKRQVPLTKGRILFQAEGAEVFYRRIEIKPAGND